MMRSGSGRSGRVEMLADRLLCHAVDDRLEILTLLALLAEHGLDGVDDLLAPAVGHCERQVHRPITRGRFLGGADGRERRVRQEIELSRRLGRVGRGDASSDGERAA